MIGCGRECLRSPFGNQSDGLRKKIAKLCLLKVIPKLCSNPAFGIFTRTVRIRTSPFFIVVCKLHEIGQRKFISLQIAHVHHPHLTDSMFVGYCHLLPNLRQRCAVDPLIGNRTSVIIQVIIHSIAGLMLRPVLLRQKAHMTEVVFTEHENHILNAFPILESRCFVIPIEVSLYLLVDGKQHRRRLPVFHILCRDPLFLLRNNIF